MISDYVTSKLRLPDLKGIQIDYISDADKDLVSFLSYCIPSCLCLLTINSYVSSFSGIKSKFYIDAFSKAASMTTNGVYFNCIDFSAEDLQTVIRAAHNAEVIVFNCCCIHCSSDLDFGADLNYNTTFLSFQLWGSMDFEERTTDWKTNPQSFSLIIEAIGKSGLKTSLQKLGIDDNETLSVSNVQEELNAKGMSHISVIQEQSSSLSS